MLLLAAILATIGSNQPEIYEAGSLIVITGFTTKRSKDTEKNLQRQTKKWPSRRNSLARF